MLGQLVWITIVFMALIQQLKRRHIFRVGIVYCVVGWLVLQLTRIIVPAIGLPEWIMPVLLLAGLFGFPFILLFVWVYEITPEGLKRAEHVKQGESLVEETRATLNKVITALLALALVLVLAEQYFPLLEPPPANTVLQSE